MATYASASALKKAIRDRTRQAMEEVSKSGLDCAEEHAGEFYTGDPEVYMRTFQMRDSPRTTGVLGYGNIFSTEIYLDQDYMYPFGTWDTKTIFNAAEYGFGNLVGTPGFWANTKEEMPNIVKAAFKNAGFQ